MADEPHELTTEEARDIFMKQVAGIVKYWQNESRSTPEGRVSGVAHSLLVLIDGGTLNLPAWKVISDPHPDDREYHKENGENWWPESHDLEHPGDITQGAALHEILYKYLRNIGVTD